ncbi:MULTISPECIES: heptaprenyl diphosphate synthase component II [Aeribacillus]|jgi:heptaprenyl diphosphate synthase|uniref:Heptaprenyl diphosphate synthase component 2 n=1 Tax=Aeribacillus pallidus TaxID=33936 RepID=A0A161Y2J5_9BACI|nr:MULTISPECIES: heptaprenyl diphosphate synthase component II [Aeribacillus]ASS91744.1 heptaprenyl diphosphate synthase component II [Aeribacillus pallidus]KZN95852.1 heptaprenyl diphosphate synthase [Aeribacillus pallidus]MDR9795574.1 heptaprenyl diphosphate synthase component II [Aeribacillus pallidus]MED0702988.1 heptaprenyl diphosphate synthase component II [Aeribacillus composti]MED1437777.1 heptaprenyl diphosphate synthase component II [Aeribacillus composti]
MKLKSFYSFLTKDLEVIENELLSSVQTKDPLIREAGIHLLQAGGKRIRPVFVLLSGMFGDYNIDRMKPVAVALELIHSASLVHDDVIDNAELRRGKPTVNAKWDNRIAMYVGDYLFARALEIITELDEPLIHRVLSKALVELCLGEIEQINDKYNFDQSYRTYVKRIKRKTALLIAVSCQLGALASGAPESVCKKLYLYGYYVGISYQIIDDLLDFTSTEEELGKPVGSDLLQGNITLPVLFAMQNEELRKKIVKINNQTTAEEIKPIIYEIKKSRAIEQSMNISDRYLQKSFHQLEGLKHGKARTSLYNIAKYIGKRKF